MKRTNLGTQALEPDNKDVRRAHALHGLVAKDIPARCQQPVDMVEQRNTGGAPTVADCIGPRQSLHA